MKSAQLDMTEFEMLYVSQNKIRAFEDTIKFAPHLFKLSKSVMITEPIVDFKSFLNSRIGRTTIEPTDIPSTTVTGESSAHLL